MRRVLLLGAAGMLGTDLAAAAPPTSTVLALTHKDLDITDASAVGRIVRDQRPDVILNAAAYTDVDGAEKDPERAMRVNGAAPGILARAAGRQALVVHYSTDYVFNARDHRPLTEDDSTEPLNVYGRSKLEGERALAASGARFLILRTQWLFGLHGRSFPRTMRDRAQQKQDTRVVNDQFGRPTYTFDLARATWDLVGRFTHHPPLTTHPSFLHVANTGITTWYDLAKRIFHAAGADKHLQPCSSAEFPRPARRPGWSALDTTRYEKVTASSMPAWENAVDRFLAQLGEEGSST